MYSYYCICCDVEFESNEVIKIHKALCNSCIFTHFVCDNCHKLKLTLCQPVHVCCKKCKHACNCCCKYIGHMCNDCCGNKCCTIL